jgi:hypothetical protein
MCCVALQQNGPLDFRLGSKGDIASGRHDFRFAPKSGRPFVSGRAFMTTRP